jgi:hypothetical protein
MTAGGFAQRASAKTTDIPYLIKINRVMNTITVYSKDENGKYTIPYKAMVCSVGTNANETILGTYKTSAKYRWKLLMGDVWGQYSTRIFGGILFHSVYYYDEANPASLSTREYNKLGSAASHGCVRLTVADAKWIYDNCPLGTTVEIYDDKTSPGPLGKPKAMKIPSTPRWDPTDPDENNPYKNKMPVISGAKNITVEWGEEVNLLKGITAKSSTGENITKNLTMNGRVNTEVAGTYPIEYTVTDLLGRTTTKQITVTVEEYAGLPEFTGISDRTIFEGRKITRAYALDGVVAYNNGKKINKTEIDVDIKEVSAVEYEITYTAYSKKGEPVTAQATFYVDNEAPVLSGIEDKILTINQVVDKELALSGVAVTDNFTKLTADDITVIIEEDTNHNYLVTYEVVDDVGNKVKQQVHFSY